MQITKIIFALLVAAWFVFGALQNTPAFSLLSALLLLWLCGWGVVDAISGTYGDRRRRKMTRAYQKLQAGTCPACGYSLQGNLSGVCPECGTAIDKWKPPHAVVHDHHAIAAFDQYSDDIRRAMILANDEAKRGQFEAIHPLHLLIGLADEPLGLAGNILRYKGLDIQRLRSAVRARLPRSLHDDPRNQIPLSVALQSIIDQAVRHALEEGHASVGTGGVLRAMLRHDPGIVATLRSCDVDADALSKELETYLHRMMVAKPNLPLKFSIDATE